MNRLLDNLPDVIWSGITRIESSVEFNAKRSKKKRKRRNKSKKNRAS